MLKVLNGLKCFPIIEQDPLQIEHEDSVASRTRRPWYLLETIVLRDALTTRLVIDVVGGIFLRENRMSEFT